jgi:hypothetical protein
MWRRIAAGVAVAAGGAGAVVAIDGSDNGRTAQGAARSTGHTAVVRRRDLVDRQRGSIIHSIPNHRYSSDFTT